MNAAPGSAGTVRIAGRRPLCQSGVMDVSVEINCELCGSANYSLPGGETDAGQVLCNDCGADQGSLGALKETLLEAVVAHSAEVQRRRLEMLCGTVPQA